MKALIVVRPGDGHVDIKVVSGEYVWSPCRDVESWEKTGDLEIPSSLLTSPEVLM